MEFLHANVCFSISSKHYKVFSIPKKQHLKGGGENVVSCDLSASQQCK